MSELKLEVRRQTAQDIGTRIEDRLEAARLEAARAEGANQMALQLQRQVEALHAHVDKDIDAGVFADLKEAQRVKDWITRAVVICGSGAQTAASGSLLARGKLQALEEAVKIVASVQQEAVKRLALLQQATLDEDGPPPAERDGPRVPGERPRESIRSRREREAQQAASAPVAAEVPSGDGTVTTPGAPDATDPG